MNKPEKIESKERITVEYCRNQGMTIFSKLQQSMAGSSDIIFSLVSSTVWQSPFELALLWIDRVAKEEWSNLADDPNDELNVRNIKLNIRRQLHFNIMALLSEIQVTPTIIQRATTRLLVREQLAVQLPTHDKDRVLASAIMLPYKRWKQALWVLSHLDLPDTIRIVDIPSLELDEKGEEVLNIHFRWKRMIDIENIPWIIRKRRRSLSMLPTKNGIIVEPVLINTIKISTTVMSRFEGIIAEKEKEAKIRGIMFAAYSWLPVWKKRSFWGDKQVDQEVPEGKLAWNN